MLASLGRLEDYPGTAEKLFPNGESCVLGFDGIAIKSLLLNCMHSVIMNSPFCWLAVRAACCKINIWLGASGFSISFNWLSNWNEISGSLVSHGFFLKSVQQSIM